MIDSDFQKRKLENSFRLLVYLLALTREYAKTKKSSILDEFDRYCRMFRDKPVTLVTHNLCHHFIDKGMDATTKYIPGVIEDLRNEWIALGFDPNKQPHEQPRRDHAA